jgi:hypothetical protein
MDLVKKYTRDNTITVSLIGPDGTEMQTIENVSLEGSRGLLVITIDEGSTYHEADMIRDAVRRALSTKDKVASIIAPSNVQINYIKF